MIFCQINKEDGFFVKVLFFSIDVIRGKKDQKNEWVGIVKNKFLFISLGQKFVKEGLFYFD